MQGVLLNTRTAAQALPHRQYRVAQTTVVNGKRGMGKTTLLDEYIEACEPRMLLFDVFNDFKRVHRSWSLEDAISDLATYTACRRRIRPPLQEDSRDWAEWAFEKIFREVSNILLVLDEMNLWSGIRANRALQKLILQGRRRGIRMVACSHHMSVLPDEMQSEATELVLLRCGRKPSDVETLRDWTDKDTALAAQRLRVGQCIYIHEL